MIPCYKIFELIGPAVSTPSIKRKNTLWYLSQFFFLEQSVFYVYTHSHKIEQSYQMLEFHVLRISAQQLL